MDNASGKPQRLKRTRSRRGGRDVIVKRPDSAKNARPHKVFPVHGGAAKVLRQGVLHRGGTLGKAYGTELAGLTAHVGGDPSLPQARLIEQGARLHLLEAMAWAEVQGARGLIRADGTAHPALDVLLRTMRERREVLKLLGLNRKAKDVPTLQEFLAQRAEQDDTQPEHPLDAE